MDLTNARQVKVASLHLRGLSPAEISVALQGAGLECSVETVCDDLAFLQQVWTAEAPSTPRHKARVLAEIREARRAAWATGDIKQVHELLKTEAELLQLRSVPL